MNRADAAAMEWLKQSPTVTAYAKQLQLSLSDVQYMGANDLNPINIDALTELIL